MVRETAMKEIDVKLPELFKNLLEIQIDDSKYIDLHNDYNCNLISYLSVTKELRISFTPCSNTMLSQVNLIFNEVSISSMSFDFEDMSGIDTIDSLYRGKFEGRNGLQEIAEDGRSYYYIEFYNGFSFELFAKGIIVVYN